MVLKLYGHNFSACTRLVALVLYEKNVPFEFYVVDLMNDYEKLWEHTKKHPFGLVPYIDDDGFILYESRAISHYIASKYASRGPVLIPTDIKGNALFQQAASMEMAYFNEYAEKAVHEALVHPLKGLPSCPAVFDSFIGQLSEKLDVYDEILSKQRYLTGDITLADLYHLPLGVMLAKAGSNVIETKPNVHRWFCDMASRPSWQAVKDDIRGIPPADAYQVSALL